MNLHDLAEERSLALHREVARRLVAEPGLLKSARLRVEGWIRDGSVHPTYARAWQDVLRRPLEEIVALLEDPSSRAHSLRRVSPFAGVVSPRERWRLWEEVRRRLVGGE